MLTEIMPSDKPAFGSSARVAILLSTYNGERHLAEQLDSILAQTHQDWLIAASDDGSSDATSLILQRYRTMIGANRMIILEGPRRGFVANFLSLACEPSLEADFFTFCDQDDIWHLDRLERALNWLRQVPPDRPALHCGRTHLVDNQGHHLGESPLFPKEPSFANALVQSLAGGNTMVFNQAARMLLMRAGNVPVASHDWWAYMLITGCGGTVRYDPTPTIDYRQHGTNLIGANSSIRDRLHRLKRMFAGHFRDWNTLNVAALQRCNTLLTPEHRATFQMFAAAREADLLPRCLGVLRSGVHRQTLFGDLGLIAAAALGKI
ncbi:glycosyl transferase family 2 [Pseudomonas sp. PIC25]|uniref:glycosyltransferase family 2 protein n=1 Tax=Pseudomonas sp. PIC25 TaxID=1958773 RepID=UPI000BAB44BB|nr:glycosyltransferase family 2 protein [Pseudomonas sp. PIC25]PAU60669.1 glycosyl transferase family 2 [Pseudomonas sp. PIC25]